MKHYNAEARQETIDFMNAINKCKQAIDEFYIHAELSGLGSDDIFFKGEMDNITPQLKVLANLIKMEGK